MSHILSILGNEQVCDMSHTLVAIESMISQNSGNVFHQLEDNSQLSFNFGSFDLLLMHPASIIGDPVEEMSEINIYYYLNCRNRPTQ